MRELMKKLISANDDMSSKRFAALVCTAAVIVLAFIATVADQHKICPSFMYESLCLIAGGGLGLSVIEKIFEKKNK
jgi:hypothetical protein